MKVSVIVKYSSYRKYLKDKNFGTVSTEEGLTAREVIEQLDVPEYYLNQITINGREQSPNTVLADGNIIVIWPPRIGGG